MKTYVLTETKSISNPFCRCESKEVNVLCVSDSFAKITTYITESYWISDYDLSELEDFLECRDVVKKSDDELYDLEIDIVEILDNE
ncbi:MAG: hypothetical protein KBT03_13195 [Bacteroidales bacterium]|nr:hypothetical protein [Candidatus Scybalousia scybalohippi]